MKRKVLFLMVCLMTIFFANAQVTSVAIVGEAVGGWPGDAGNPGPTDVHQMTSTDNVHWTLSGVVVTNAILNGGAKFRANNAWDINWGSASFPSGTGTQGGANILTVGGTYDVTFNSTTGEYNFGGGAPIPVVKLVGTATSADITMTTTDATIYTATNVTLLAGDAQFNIDGSLLVGGTTFPTGTAEEGVSIPVTAGTYSTITFNYGDGSYSFTAAPVFNSVAVVGSGAGGWPGTPGNPGPTDINQLSTTDGITYTGNVALTGVDPAVLGSGELKFRQNNSWDAPNLNWGGDAFPVGTASTTGANIVVTAPGYYYVTFNTSTLAYTFSIPSIAIVGPGVGGWPGDPGNPGPTDVNQLTTTDGLTYSISGLTVVDGLAKFRQNNNWDINWGGNVDPATFPTGTGVQGGTNIPTTAGTYDVSFNRMTGIYGFTVLGTQSFAKAGFKVYPNPTQNSWNFSSSKGNIQSVQIIDVLGKTIMTISPADTNATVDASSLNAGMYFAKIATATATETVKLVKN